MTTNEGQSIEQAVARLDRFLSGAAVFSGQAREYKANAFLIDMSRFESMEDSLRAYFHWVDHLDLPIAEPLSGGTRELEVRIRPLLLRNSKAIIEDGVCDLRKYLSFVVMDMIFEVSSVRGRQVLMLSSDHADDPGNVFFCINLGGSGLVLQFLRNVLFDSVEGP